MGCKQCLGIRKVFGKRIARGDLRRYRKRGPAATTRMLLDALTSEGIAGATVLDIGGGVGAISNHLLDNGARLAMLVDASAAYLDAAREEAERQGHGESMRFYEGDFVDLAADLDPATIVTLDRVVCCYDDMPGLISASVGRAELLCALVYPRDTWWNRAGVALVNLLVKVTGTGFRAFVHREREVAGLIEGAGFTRVFGRNVGLWLVVVYRRTVSPVGESEG
ncbi:MAG: methyltransferase domain-containing protein [Trueperaceae bacterium]